jgi:hypothetical protein
MKMEKPLLYQQYKKLIDEKVPNAKIIANLEAMEDWKPMDKHTDALRQLRTFLRRDTNTYELQMMITNG